MSVTPELSLDALKSAIDEGIIELDFDRITQAYQMKLDRDMLEHRHHHKIYQGKDGLWYTYVDSKEGDKKYIKIKRKTREKLEQELVRRYKAEEEAPDIDKVFYEWIAYKYDCKEVLAQSKLRYENDFDRFFINNDEARILRGIPIRCISEDDLERFIRRTIAGMELSRKSYNGLQIILRGIFRHAKRKKYTYLSITQFFGDLELSDKVFKRVQSDPKADVFTNEETHAIVDYLKNSDDLRDLALLLMFHTGLRVGELSALTRRDVSGDSNCITIARTEVNYKGESGKNEVHIQEMPKTAAGFREVIIDSEGRRVLDRILEKGTGEYLFMENGKRIRSQGHRKHLYRVCDKIGIPRKSPHKIRRTYGTMLIDSGVVDDSTVSEQLGHADITTTRRYYYYSRQSRKNKIDAIENAIKL